VDGLLHDIALLEVITPMVFDEYVQPTCLPTDENQVFLGNTNCWITGWGVTQGMASSFQKI